MRRRLDDQNCSVARALDILADPWTFLILREAFSGARRFRDFEEGLEISKNILSARLSKLVEARIFQTEDAGRYGRRLEYRLTAKGKDLIVVLTAVREWGDRWVSGEGNEPVVVVDKRTGRRLPRLRILDDEGQPVRGSDMKAQPGPGARPANPEASEDVRRPWEGRLPKDDD